MHSVEGESQGQVRGGKYRVSIWRFAGLRSVKSVISTYSVCIFVDNDKCDISSRTLFLVRALVTFE